MGKILLLMKIISRNLNKGRFAFSGLRNFKGIFLFLISLSAILAKDPSAQIQPVYDRGVMGLIQSLKRLNTSASAMMIGAHPDDEDTALLAYLARGESARTAYLSLTRGDGGQNIIGPELGEALGIIRTEELLQARRLDGAEQYFTRAYDYGFSKTLAEAQSKWPEEVILCDAVKAIRDFKPLIVISQYTGTPADGHGQHQYAGWLAPRTVKAAADPAKCRQSGEPWKVQKFFVRQGFRATGDPQMRINTGRYDHTLGRSYFEIAMEARSQHKSQEQGVLELKGEMFSGLNLIDGVPGSNSLFDGVDVSVTAIASQSANAQEQFRTHLNHLSQIAQKAYSDFDPREPAKIVSLLAAGYKAAFDAEWSTRYPHSKALVRFKQREFAKALKLAAGLQIDALAEKETVVPGEEFAANVRVFFPANELIRITKVDLNVPTGWTVNETETPAPRQQGFLRSENPNFARTYNIRAASNALPSQPYWLSDPRDGEMFRWPQADHNTWPFEPAIATAMITAKIGDVEVKFEQPFEYRFADDVRGELRRPLALVPGVTVELDRSLIMVPVSNVDQVRRLSVTVTNHSRGPVSGKVSLDISADKEWGFKASSKTFELERNGERTTIGFEVTIPAGTKAGDYQISANALVGEGLASSTMRAIAYPHIQTHRFYQRAAADVKVVPLETAPVKVGYIMGSGDRVPEALTQIGLTPEFLTDADVANSDLSRFDVIVVGIRAYQVRPALVANNKRLIDFMTAGGTLVVQYQLSAYAQQNLPPYPAQQGPRTVDEDAEVRILRPEHPLMNFPNKIGPSDFEGWVQERNLYNFGTMDERYTGILETHDPGETENQGGLVVADVGKGKYVYCSYSLFRQLPAGVAGAYRLLANMVSLPKAK